MLIMSTEESNTYETFEETLSLIKCILAAGFEARVARDESGHYVVYRP